MNSFGTINKFDRKNSQLLAEEYDIFTLEHLQLTDQIDSDIIVFDPIECLFWKYTDPNEQDTLKKRLTNLITQQITSQKIVVLTTNFKGSKYLEFLRNIAIKIKI